MSFTYSATLWPWSGFLAVSFGVTEKVNQDQWEGIAQGHITVTVSSPPQVGAVCTVFEFVKRFVSFGPAAFEDDFSLEFF